MHTCLGPELVREVQTGGCTCSGAFQVRRRLRRRRMLGCGWAGVMGGVRGWSFRALASLTLGCAGVSESLSLFSVMSAFAPAGRGREFIGNGIPMASGCLGDGSL
jgi:hypothetical protein